VTSATLTPVPARAGIGLRFPHHQAVRESRPCVGWLEVHSENYLGGGTPLRHLEALRRDYPISLHGVGLSLGTAGPLDAEHLTRIAALARRIEPALVSEHLAWSVAGGVYLNDLLPLPYTEEALAVMAEHVDAVQQALGRAILIENPSTYLQFVDSAMAETEFLAALVARTGCGLLLDVNNVAVSAGNHGEDAAAYLAAVPEAAVGEIHLAGHSLKKVDGITLRIDDHGSAVDPAVWALFEAALARLGPRPTLIEWDSNIPALPVLLAEAEAAEARLEATRRDARAA
jgi:uncharacterized protein (UPF0276 family)